MKDDLKCYVSPSNNESKLLKRIYDYIIEFVCGYALVPLFGGVRILLVGQCIYIYIFFFFFKYLALQNGEREDEILPYRRSHSGHICQIRRNRYTKTF